MLSLIKDGGFNILICEAVCARVNRLVNTPVPRSYVGYTINNTTDDNHKFLPDGFCVRVLWTAAGKVLWHVSYKWTFF